MELTKHNEEIHGSVGIPGLINATVKYKVASSDVDISWSGPTIPIDVWKEVLAYFKWTYETHKSESQVRLYVSTVDNTWRAWAFPQKAGTGMTSEELPVPQGGVEETPEEAMDRFNEWGVEPSGNWTRFGSIHHHCAATAFQSGVDEKNEKNQDGLHITVGKIDEDEYDIHCRFYVGGVSINPNMSIFFDIGEDLAGLLPVSKWNEIARAMMCVPAANEQYFPEKWKQNYIKVERAYTRGSYVYEGAFGSASTVSSGNAHWSMSWMERCEKAIINILTAADENKLKFSEITELIEEMNNEATLIGKVCAAMKDMRLQPDDIMRYWPKDEKEATASMAADAIKSNHNVTPKGRKNGKKGKKNHQEEQGEFPVVQGTMHDAQVEAIQQQKMEDDGNMGYAE